MYTSLIADKAYMYSFCFKFVRIVVYMYTVQRVVARENCVPVEIWVRLSCDRNAQSHYGMGGGGGGGGRPLKGPRCFEL